MRTKGSEIASPLERLVLLQVQYRAPLEGEDETKLERKWSRFLKLRLLWLWSPLKLRLSEYSGDDDDDDDKNQRVFGLNNCTRPAIDSLSLSHSHS